MTVCASADTTPAENAEARRGCVDASGVYLQLMKTRPRTDDATQDSAYRSIRMKLFSVLQLGTRLIVAAQAFPGFALQALQRLQKIR